MLSPDFVDILIYPIVTLSRIIKITFLQIYVLMSKCKLFQRLPSVWPISSVISVNLQKQLPFLCTFLITLLARRQID